MSISSSLYGNKGLVSFGEDDIDDNAKSNDNWVKNNLMSSKYLYQDFYNKFLSTNLSDIG